MFDFDSYEEELMTFWVNRFVISTYYCLNDPMEAKTKQPNFVEEDCLESLEDLYYAAILALFVTYKN